MKYLKILLPVAHVFFAVACIFDGAPDTRLDTHTGSESEVTISMVVPASSQQGSRALTDAQEAEVREVDILVFDNTGILTERAAGVDIEDVNTTAGVVVKRFRTNLMRARDVTLMMMINSRQQIDAAGVQIGTTTVDDIRALRVDIAAAGWNADPASPTYRPIPMWGVREHLDIDNNALALDGANGIRAVRMLARVNVRLDGSIAPEKFTLGSVHLYNSNSAASLVPLDSATPTPNVPAGAAALGPIRYAAGPTSLINTIYMAEARRGDAPTSTSGDFLKNPCIVVGGWYGSATDMTYYRVDFAEKTNGNLGYLDILRNHSYNVAIRSVAGPGKRTPDEAFHSIPKNIEAGVVKWNDNEISGIIFDGVNLLAVSPSRLELPSDASEPAYASSLRIITDVAQVGSTPGGWTAKIFKDREGTAQFTPAEKWLSMTPTGASGNYPDGDTAAMEYLKNETGAPRTAYVHISAGRLTYVVEVVQSAEPHYGLELFSQKNFDPANRYEAAELNVPTDIASGSLQHHDFVLRWSPADAIVKYRITQAPTARSTTYNLAGLNSLDNASSRRNYGVVDNHANGTYNDPYSASLGTPAVYTGIEPGHRYFDIASEAFAGNAADPFAETSDLLEFEMMSPRGMLRKSLLVRQKKDNIRVEPRQVYLLDGVTQHRVAVRSNFPWRVDIAPGGDPRAVIRKFSTQYGGGNEYREGYFSFTLIDNITASPIDKTRVEANVSFVFSRLNERGEWVPWNDWRADGTEDTAQRQYQIYCVAATKVRKANSYMVRPGGMPIMIPLEIAADATLKFGINTLGTGDAISSRLLWSDHPEGVVRASSTSGVGSRGFLVVVPGTEEGNAVLAAYNDSQQAVGWSFHIWNTSYDPSNGGTTHSNYLEWKAYTSNNPDAIKDGSKTQVWMDRNLGALKAEPNGDAPNGADIYGFYYQHGRKDPFPGPKVSSNAGTQNTIDTYPAGSFQLQGSRPEGGLAEAIKNPTKFYSNDPQWLGQSRWDLWLDNSPSRGYQNTNSSKGFFDPCPEGWRLPYLNGMNMEVHDGSRNDARNPWNGIKRGNIKDVDQYCTQLGNPNGGTYLGYWPRGGYLHNGVGNVYEFGIAHYWVAAQNDGSGGRRIEWVTNSQSTGSNEIIGAFGGDWTDYAFPVRCIKE